MCSVIEGTNLSEVDGERTPEGEDDGDARFRAMVEPIIERARRFWDRVEKILEAGDARRRGQYRPASEQDKERLLNALGEDTPVPFDPIQKDD